MTRTVSHSVAFEARTSIRDEVGSIVTAATFVAVTRTRIVDAQGNEIYEGLVDARDAAEEHGVAPPHPDVEGRNPETAEAPATSEASELPPTVEVVEDQKKEQSIEQDAGEAKPASEAKAATQEAE